MNETEYLAKKMELRQQYDDILGKPLTDKQWGAITYHAYEEGHSAGREGVLAEINNLRELVVDLLKED